MISPNASIASAADAISKSNGKALLVGDDGTVSGLITRDLIEKEKTIKADAPVHDFAISEFEHVHPDHSLEVVIDRLGKSPGLLPVVSRSNAQQILGVITPQSLTQFVQRNWENNGGSA